MQSTKGVGNPLPFQDVPVDFRDFDSAKAFMIENINLIKVNWKPRVPIREVLLAETHVYNIASAARASIAIFGFFTPEQAEKLIALQICLSDWVKKFGRLRV